MPRSSKKNHRNRLRRTLPNEGLPAAADATSPDLEVGDGTPDPMALHQAVETVRPLLCDIAEQSYIPIRLDCATMAMRLLSRLRAIERYRPTIAILPLVRQDWLAHLEPIALALIQVDSLSKIAVATVPPVRATFKESVQLRDRLRRAVVILEAAGLVPKGLLKKQEGKRGYIQTAQDLLVLGKVLRDNWEALGGYPLASMNDVERTTVLAQSLFRNARKRNDRSAIPADVARLKKQVYTLFLLAYGELRRCLEFIERGAADRVAPTLYEGRGRKRRRGPEPLAAGEAS